VTQVFAHHFLVSGLSLDSIEGFWHAAILNIHRHVVKELFFSFSFLKHICESYFNVCIFLTTHVLS